MVKAFTQVKERWRLIKTAAFLLSMILFYLLSSQEVYVNSDYLGNVFVISDACVQLEYHSDENFFTLINLKNNRVYRTDPLANYQTVAVNIISPVKMEITQAFNGKNSKVTAVSQISLEAGRIKTVMVADPDSPLKEPVIFPGTFVGMEVDQHFAIPYAEGIYVPANEPSDFGNYLMWTHKSTMPFVGMTDSKSGIMITSDSPADTAVNFVKAKTGDPSNYCMQLMHYPEKGVFGYNRVFYIDLIGDDGYNEMAKVFRKHLEDKQARKPAKERDVLKTLQEKTDENSTVKSLIGSVDFWLGAEDMKSKRIIDDLTTNGVKKVLLNFQYGWKVYENEKRPEVVQYAVDRGMISSRYDNYSDIFDPKVEKLSQRYRTDGFYERVIIGDNGNPMEGYLSYYKGNRVMSYRVSPKMALNDIDAYLTEDLEENHYLGRFVDVTVSVGLCEDYSKNHPANRRQDLEARQAMLEKISSGYSMITGTEETAWWAIPVTHYSEGTMTIAPPTGSGEDWRNPTNNPGELYLDYTVNPSVRIPLKSLVYHDCHISGWYTGDSASKVMDYWKTKDLLTILYGSMQLVFPKDYAFWQEHKDRFLWSIKMTQWAFGKVGYEEMQRHEFVSEDGLVQKTSFSNGIRIVANFSDTPYQYGLFTIPPEDFLVINRWCVYSSKIIEKKLAL